MPAVVVHAAGDLRIDPVTTAGPGPGEVVVAVELGGICGSDLHYLHDGGVGDFRLREPLVLGHEVVGRVAALGEDADAPAVGTPVAVHPATVCGRCGPCRSGRRNVCVNVRYLGSAARFPHVQGGFRSELTVPAEQVLALPDGLAPERAVLAEPLAVALHAVHRAGDVLGREVLVTGAGPIGVLVVAALHAAGAARITVTDLVPEALAVARAVGASHTVALGSDPDVAPDSHDVVVEASGAPAALRTAVTAARRGGVVVLLGMLPPGEVAFAGNVGVTRELDVRGSFRFDAEFGQALALLAGGLAVDPVVTGVMAADSAVDAFALASDRTRACKVLLDWRT